MRINSDGNVGIGTTSPGYKLDVAGGIKIGGEETLPSAIGSMYLSYNSAINRIYYGDGTGYDLRFSKRGAGVTTDFVTLKDNGNVGIGTTSPGAKLDILGDLMIHGVTGKQIHRGGYTASSGIRELFRVSQYAITTSGTFTLTATRNGFVHVSKWAWSSNHPSYGMLTQITGGEYSDITVYMDVNYSGDVIFSANW